MLVIIPRLLADRLQNSLGQEFSTRGNVASRGHWTVSGEGFVITTREEGVEKRGTVVCPVEVRDAGKA